MAGYNGGNDKKGDWLVEDLCAKIETRLAEFVLADPRNAMPAHRNMRMYDAPLVGFAAADDPLFSEFRRSGVVGERHLPPCGWLPDAKTVVSVFLPFTEEVRRSNRAPGLPSEEWASARIDGEAFNNDVRRFLLALFREMGADAVSPALDPRFSVQARVSNWSERHVAYAAGLGTFSLSRTLITKKGAAGRLSSVVTALALPPTAREYDTYYAYCPFLSRGKCGACIRRCPPGAITAGGKDNALCSDYIDHTVMPLFAPRYGCAKCSVATPCEKGIPAV